MALLTDKQEAFCQHYVELGVGAEAYRRAYDAQGKPEGIHVSASRLLADPKIALRIQELRDRLAELEIWKRIDSLRTLSDIARHEQAQDKDKVAAVKAINAMHGWDKTTIDHTSSDRSMSPKGRTLDDFYQDPDVPAQP